MRLSETERRNARRFIMATVFIYALGFGIVIPVLPALIMQLEGIDLPAATLIGGYLAASYALFQFAFGPAIGGLGDRFGRRPVLLLSLFGFAADYALMGLAPNVAWLFAGRMLAGALGAVFGPANAAMADMSSSKERARNFGLVGAAFGLGFIIGPAVGGLVAEYSLRLPFFIAAGLALANGIYGLFVFRETMDMARARPFQIARANPLGALIGLRHQPALLMIALAYLLWMTSSGIYTATWTYYAIAQFDWDSRMIGYSLGIVGASLVVFQSQVIGPAVARFGERKVALIGLVGGIVGFAMFTAPLSTIAALLVCAMVGVQGMVMPSLNAMMSRRVEGDAQGELQGLVGSLTALAALAAPLLYNNLLATFIAADRPTPFPGAPFILALLIALVTVVIIWRLPRTSAATPDTA
ncbi:MFS transporter [Blastomonas sp.]|uniref:MFS transporter n=1 Tax=Blastomonas sp. TaxID=1909299 RepID=UPI003593313F